MKKKRLIWTLGAGIGLIAIILGWFSCRARQTGLNPDLLSGAYPLKLPVDAGRKLGQAIKKQGLEKIFIKERVNIFFPDQAWLGRINDGGISRQALFSVGNAGPEFQVGKLPYRLFQFAIYNPAGSTLIYRVGLKTGKGKKNLFSTQLQGFHYQEYEIDLGGVPQENARLVLETGGTGAGAWLNPRFSQEKKKPRLVVMIVLDTLRRDHVSLYGYSRQTTPQLDRLAADAQVFTNAYSSTSWTLPAHVSLFSGKDLVGHGVTAPEQKIPLDYPLLAEVFQANGFATAAFTGGGFLNAHYGFHRGFQVYSNLPGRVFLLDSSDKVLDNFKNFLGQAGGNDLFVFLHTYQIHAPYKFPPKFVRHFNPELNVNLQGPANYIRDKRVECFKPLADKDRQTLIDLYDTSIYYADQALVGGVIQVLKEKDLYRDALVAVLSDHGEEFYEHGGWEHGHSVYRELISIPLVIKYPGNGRQGRVDDLVSIADVPGLIIAALGIEDGRKSFPVSIGQKERLLPVLFPHSPIIKEIPARLSFVTDKFHFIYNVLDFEKLKIFNPQPRGLEIYELYRDDDGPEKTNIARQQPKVLNEFRQHLKALLQWLKDLKAGQGKLDENLERELKSLGYLNN